MEWMFCSYSSLTNLDLSNFNTKNVTNMELMFFDCFSLINLNLSDSKNAYNLLKEFQKKDSYFGLNNLI